MKIRGFQIEPIYVVKEALEPGWSWVSDENRWTGFHLWYLYQNEVRIQTETGEYRLREGDTFLFDLSQNHRCTHDPQKPAALFSAYFHCDRTQELQALLQSGAIPKQNHPPLFSANLQLFEEATRSSNTPEETMLWLGPVFQQVLSPFAGHARQSKIAEICREIDAAPQKDWSLDQLASRAGYSKNQLIRLFRQATGYTPYAYMIRARIARAKHLLLFSDYMATEIAGLLGYSDLNHFSSQFYQKTGCYPSQYAESQKKREGKEP